MELRDFAVQILMDKFGAGTDHITAAAALDDLTQAGGDFDLEAIVDRFTRPGGELAQKAHSWLSNGSNEIVSALQVEEALGNERIAAFAEKLGIDRDEASRGLSDVLPELIDKSSHGGNLIGVVATDDGMSGLARRLFR